MFLKNSIKRILNSKLFRITGVSLINYDLLKYLKHYLWIFHLRKIPKLNITYREAKEVTDEDVLLCRRLIASYHKATLNKAKMEDNTSQIWAQGINKYCSIIMSW